RRSRRIPDPVEQTGTMGERRAVRGNDGPTLGSTQLARLVLRFCIPQNGAMLFNRVLARPKHLTRRSRIQARRQFGDKKRGLKSLVQELSPAGPPRGSRPAGIGGGQLRMSLQMKREPA